MNVGYHEIQVGMEFEELDAPGARMVRVVRAMAYSCDCTVISGRGAGQNLRVFRKRLSDPKAWRRVK